MIKIVHSFARIKTQATDKTDQEININAFLTAFEKKYFLRKMKIKRKFLGI